MKYKIEIEMSKHHCMECPLLDIDDRCKLQPDFDDDIETTWEELLSNCPLEEIKCFKVVDSPKRFPNVGVIHNFRCGNCGSELCTINNNDEIRFCAKCGVSVVW